MIHQLVGTGAARRDEILPLVVGEFVGSAPYVKEDGHHVGSFLLRGTQYEIDLTEVLGLGVVSLLNETDPPRLFSNLDIVGGWRYTLHQAWLEAKDAVDVLESEFEMWRAGRYLGAEKVLQDEKALAVMAKSRSVSEQVTRTAIEARLILDNAEEWTGWRRQTLALRDRERNAEALYKAVDSRGRELQVMVANLGFLLRKP